MSVRWQFIQHFFLSDGLDVKEEFVRYCQSRPLLDPCPRVGYFLNKHWGKGKADILESREDK